MTVVPLSECPTEAQLHQYLADALPLEESSLFELHMEQCDACEANLRRILDSQSFDILVTRNHRDAANTAPHIPATPDYECLDLIETGGFGTVWKMRDKQFNRLVAVKVLKARHTKQSQLVRRFFAEAQICSQLSHPYIVPIHDMGTLQDGRPYFAMKLVEGQRLNEAFAKPEPGENLLPRIQSFGHVCQAMAFAHENSIIHRDLKPQNIMVGVHGEVQVMDWGLAKSLRQSQDTSDTAVRETSRRQTDQTEGALGTYPYMAPEQAADATKASKAADVFSLGAILCEMLTGKPPYVADSQEHASALAAAGDLSGAFDRLNQTKADKRLIALAKQCLARDINDRPTDASEVSSEVNSFLASVAEELETAKVENARQQLALVESGKRKRLWSALALTLLAGTITASVLAAVAYVARNEESAARSKAEKAEQLADQRASSRRQIVDTFVKSFKSADVRDEGVTGDMTAVELLQATKANIASPGFADDVQTTNELKSAVGKAFQNMGRYSEAIPIFEETVAAWRELKNDSELVEDLGRLATCYENMDKVEPALKAADEVVVLTKKLYGQEHKKHLRSINDLAVAYTRNEKYAEAIRLLQDSFGQVKAVHGENGIDTLIQLDNLAGAYLKDNQLEKADEYSNKASTRFKEHHPGHPEMLDSLALRAAVLKALGRKGEAFELYEAVYGTMKEKLSFGHESTLTVMQVLSEHYQQTGRMDKAIALYKEAIPFLNSSKSQRLYTIYNNLGCVYLHTGDMDEALKMFKECSIYYDRKLPSADPVRINAFNQLANAHVRLGQYESAAPILEDLARNQDDSENPIQSLMTRKLLATCYQRTDRLAQAIDVFRTSAKRATELFDEKHPLSMVLHNGLAGALNSDKQYAEAEALYRKVMALHDSMKLPANQGPIVVVNSLATVLQNTDRLEEAIPLFEKAYNLCQTLVPRENPDTIRTMINLGSAYSASQRVKEGESLLAEAKGMSRKRLGNHYLTTLAMKHHQSALLQSQKFADAKLNGQEWVAALEASKKVKDLPLANISLAEALIEVGDFDDAEKLLSLSSATAELPPEERTRIQYLRAWSSFRENRTEGSAAELISSFEELSSMEDLDVDKRWYCQAVARRLVRLFEQLKDTESAAKWQGTLKSLVETEE